MCYRTEINVADQNCCLALLWNFDTVSTRPRLTLNRQASSKVSHRFNQTKTDAISSGVQQGSHRFNQTKTNAISSGVQQGSHRFNQTKTNAISSGVQQGSH